MTLPRKIPSQAGFEPGSSSLEVDALTTRPTRRFSPELHRFLKDASAVTDYLSNAALIYCTVLIAVLK